MERPRTLSMEQVRPEVQAFALMMERALQEKAASEGETSPGWRVRPVGSLMAEIHQMVSRLDLAVMDRINLERNRQPLVEQDELISWIAAHIANHSLFIADRVGKLPRSE